MNIRIVIATLIIVAAMISFGLFAPTYYMMAPEGGYLEEEKSAVRGLVFLFAFFVLIIGISSSIAAHGMDKDFKEVFGDKYQ